MVDGGSLSSTDLVDDVGPLGDRGGFKPPLPVTALLELRWLGVVGVGLGDRWPRSTMESSLSLLLLVVDVVVVKLDG